MVHSLRVKLTLALLLTSLVGIGLAVIFIQQLVTREFDSYVLDQHRAEFIDNVTTYYVQYQTWDEVDRALRPQSSSRQPPPQNQSQSQPPQNSPPPAPARFALVDESGHVVIPFEKYRMGDHVSDDEIERGAPIEVDGQIVGTVITTDDSLQRDTEAEAYLRRANQAFVAAAIGAVVVALLLGILAARIYLRPLRELTSAVQNVAKGNLEQRVPVRSRDELGILATQFNQMSADLAYANQLRRQMTADIAHDLRTPLTVIAGYLESLRDGILNPTSERFEMMYNETQLLQRLVEDLRTLSLADAGELTLQRQRIAPQQLLERTADTYHHAARQQHITLDVATNMGLPVVEVDPERLVQVLGNLVSNALRYTPESGKITLGTRADGAYVMLTVQDNGRGITPEKLPYIFERFYRGDESRPQDSGESGLGLAIAKSIVEAHEGTIAVESTVNVGTTFTVTLPVAS